MHILAIALALLLTGCTTVPVSVGGLGLCLGVCRFEIQVAQPVAQSPAEKIGGGLAGLLAAQFEQGQNK
jgi:starvation-inducible outer membrane lipoprotein